MSSYFNLQSLLKDNFLLLKSSILIVFLINDSNVPSKIVFLLLEVNNLNKAEIRLDLFFTVGDKLEKKLQSKSGNSITLRFGTSFSNFFLTEEYSYSTDGKYAIYRD